VAQFSVGGNTATMQKQGANVFESLVAAFNGAPPQPSFA